MKRFLSVVAALALIVAGTAFAVNQHDDMTFLKTVTVVGNTTLSGSLSVGGAITQGGATTFEAGVTLDDGSGASPSLTFKDGTDETAVFSKVDAGFLTVTTVAGDGLNILTGNLKVGNGTPGVAQDGEDAYVEGTFEVDGASQFDGAVAVNGALTTTSTVGITGTAGETVIITRTLADHTAENAMLLSVTAADTTSAVTTQFGLHINNAASTEGLDAAIAITNADTDDAVDDAIRLVDGGGGFTNYFYASQFKISGLGVITMANSETINNSTNGQIGFGESTANSDKIAIKPATSAGATSYTGIITTSDLLTADKTYTLPDQTGLVKVISTATKAYPSGHAEWTMTAAESQASHFTATGGGGDAGIDAVLPSCVAGQIYTFTNTSGQIVTFKVTGQTGGTIANTKSAMYMCNGTDVLEVWEQS